MWIGSRSWLSDTSFCLLCVCHLTSRQVSGDIRVLLSCVRPSGQGYSCCPDHFSSPRLQHWPLSPWFTSHLTESSPNSTADTLHWMSSVKRLRCRGTLNCDDTLPLPRHQMALTSPPPIPPTPPSHRQQTSPSISSAVTGLAPTALLLNTTINNHTCVFVSRLH